MGLNTQGDAQVAEADRNIAFGFIISDEPFKIFAAYLFLRIWIGLNAIISIGSLKLDAVYRVILPDDLTHRATSRFFT